MLEAPHIGRASGVVCSSGPASRPVTAAGAGAQCALRGASRALPELAGELACARWPASRRSRGRALAPMRAPWRWRASYLVATPRESAGCIYVVNYFQQSAHRAAE